MPFSTIAVKLQLPKTNKKVKIGDQKNLLVNFIFLKVVTYVMLLVQTILHHK